MLVTFISQCEKKALSRTRRILDAFANRIGDNVWQTAITEEGLLAVKQLLRQTASKSTAVSCHRVRTRQRTELIWIVGNKRKFNHLGIVAVNWTTKEIIMDTLPIETTNFLANTHQQPLSQHLFAVGFVAAKLLEKLEIGDKKLLESAFVSGILHDIGKLDPQFQQWLLKKINKVEEDTPTPDDGIHIDTSISGYTKFSFEKYPRHNELSWLITNSLLDDNKGLNAKQLGQIFHSIYWHHTRPFRKENKYFNQAKGIYKLFNNPLNNIKIEKFMEQVIAVLNDVSVINQKYGNTLYSIPAWNNVFKLTDNEIPEYKIYDDLAEELEEFQANIIPNALNNLIRSAVISADRIVSKLSAGDLQEYLMEGTLEQILDNILLDQSNLSNDIKQCIDKFEQNKLNSERNQSQSIASTSLAELTDIAEFDEQANICVLQGPAGCGKTKIALEWALKTKVQKIIWVCPRVQVCLGLLNDLTQSDYLPNSKIEIFTGEYKKILTNGKTFEETENTSEECYFSGDIVITTIDQIINNIISHHKVTAMMDFMQAHIVFDEFHEIIAMPAFNLLFAELIEGKKQRKHKANTLLVSATPHDYFIEKVLGIDKSYIIRVESFNQTDYQLDFMVYDDKEEQNPMIEMSIADKKSTFIITNTAQDAQLGFLHHQDENSTLLHSKYTKMDKVNLFNQVFNCFKRGGNHQYQILRSGPIVQASLNISCERMYTDITSPENYLQRLGRLNRFGEYTHKSIYTAVIPNSAKNGKKTSHQAKFLANLYVWNTSFSWLNYLQDYLLENEKKTIKLNELYQVYQDFYADSLCQDKIKEDIENILKKSVELIKQKVMDPISIFPKAKKIKNRVSKIAKTSLRGNNRFVQMAVCHLDKDLTLSFIDEYAYDENTDHSSVIVGLTESVERIQGNGDSSKNLLSFMQAKHHNIKEGASKVYKDFILLSEARSPENPIYLSYIPNDLAPIGGERERHQHSVYYVITEKQPVGVMSLDKLPTAELL
ncbi:CRISPR-associated helicase Cas3' [Pasteurella skyensis]|uniref:CRISPR-associated helicase Cas3 n=1 Tax=Phocoenobacter skyensis TaxID=97481 RepID=A0AAJ6NDJ0_9PAST|nr:CRISPR-associated helicase Cas3' [Pasteurella skyensis]MDP8170648.1 CRISPR-associated helicase Cas3' [Pasteurella skyensis]MDP8174806.1 CRISPR-associated helicase Cas3' [Pasteurella skyensis]